MTMQIVSKLQKIKCLKKVGILGMTFKPDIDDVRNSLSFKLKKQLERCGAEVVPVDPYLDNCQDMSRLKGSDAVVLMTPHSQFGELKEIIEFVGNEKCTFVDIWGFWKEMKNSARSGFFFAREVKR
jgi:UDP-N-acetyl-D-mannosaminuronic acid dehydrogenase